MGWRGDDNQSSGHCSKVTSPINTRNVLECLKYSKYLQGVSKLKVAVVFLNFDIDMSDRDFHQQQEGYGLGHVGNINNNTQYSNHQQQQLQQQQHHHQQHQHQYHHHQQQQSHQQQSHQQQYHPQSSTNQQTYKEYPGATFIQHEGGYPEEYYQDQQQYYDPNYYLYYQQQYIDHQYPQYEGQYQEYHNNYDEADISNLDEIDRVIFYCLLFLPFL